MALPGGPGLAERLEQEPAGHHVERGGRLVEDERRRIVNEGPGDVGPLLLAGRELAAGPIRELGQPESRDEALHARVQEGLGDLVQPAEVAEHLTGRQPLVQRGVAGEKAERSA